MLTVPQQAKAALAYIKHQILDDPTTAHLLSDPLFTARLDMNFVTLYGIQTELYGWRHDCLTSILELIKLMAASWSDRPDDMKALDLKQELDPGWFQTNQMLGGVCYVDKYAKNLEGVKAKIPYFKELGLTYLHLMPMFKVPEPKNDGGYAVSSYREIAPALGNITHLRSLATALRHAGISLVVDFVFNHTSNEHEWAMKAVAGEKEYEGYYWIFNDRWMPDQYEKDTREIFPDDHPGNFIQMEDGRWVWATFMSFQWDLNYSNPAVFRAMAGEMLSLANLGVNILRMDAVAFIWKQYVLTRPSPNILGTPCESLPEAHKILRCFNAVCRIAAPSLLFKSEAIVHPNFIGQYIDRYECQLSYNPLQMCLIWEAMATRSALLLGQALERRHNISPDCAWVNYVRSHDDIGWNFADEDIVEYGKNGYEHRRFLNAFYVNRHPGSFARGVPFQDNPKTGDCRISGTTASLAGVESGATGSIERIILAHSIIMSTGGIPLLYLGDEVGQLNDYSYMTDPARWSDSRWSNRPVYPATRYEEAKNSETDAGKIYGGFKHLIHLRKTIPELGGGGLIGFQTHNPAVLGYQRPGIGASIICLANFADTPQWVGAPTFTSLPEELEDLVSGHRIRLKEGVELRSHQFMWLRLPK